MSELSGKQKSHNLPTYINIPFFLYQDDRLDKAATLIAAFFYSLHTSSMKIIASSDYLCQLAGIKKRQFYYIMNLLEELGYIQRKGFTNRKKIHWVHRTKSEIIVNELDTSALDCTNVQELNTSAVQCTQLVQSSALNLCTPVHTYIKEDTKDYKKLTTVNEEMPSSSSFFSEKQKEELLSYKLKKDERPDELFLSHCQYHIESQNNDYGKFERLTGLKHILTKLYEIQDIFKAKGFGKEEQKQEKRTKPPTKEDFENYKRCVPGYEWVRDWRSQHA
jgi:hypothetical protein